MAKKNQPTWHRYTFIALVVAGLGLLSAFLFLVTRILLNIGMFTGATTDTLNQGLLISAAVIVLGLAIYTILEPQKTRQVFTGRQARYGSNALVITVAFLGLLVVINYLVYTNDKSWDLTEDQQNTLAPESINTLKSMPEPVVARAFFTDSSSFTYYESLLKLFEREGKDKFARAPS